MRSEATMSALAGPSGSSPATSSDSDFTSTSESEDSPANLPRSRKRPRRVAEWKATQRKTCRNSGQPYKSKTGKQVGHKH